MTYEFKPDGAKPDAVERADEADNPKLPKRSTGDRKSSPVSEAEVRKNGFPSTNDADPVYTDDDEN